MKDNSKRRAPIVAAAVLLALGVSPAIAQQGTGATGQTGQQQEQQEQQTERDWQQEQQQRTDRDMQRDQETTWEREREAETDDWRQDQQRAETQRDTQQAQRDQDRDRDQYRDAGQDFEQLTQEHDNLSKFVEAVRAAGMERSLTDGTSYTIFAPTNEAFEQHGEVELDSENWEQIAELLRGHIVADDVDREKLRQIPQAMTLHGGMLDVREEDGELRVGDARVTDEEIQIGALRIYTIDEVLETTAAVGQRQMQQMQREDDDFGDQQRTQQQRDDQFRDQQRDQQQDDTFEDRDQDRDQDTGDW
jgi:uncharacterized surface protein with fasciclin (FAS1) repeats